MPVFSSREERDYFWVSHAQLVHAAAFLVTVVVAAAAVFLRPSTAHPPLSTPVNFTHMEEDFTRRLQGMYNSSGGSYRLATPAVLRQIVYHNLLPCEPDFMEDHDTQACDIEAKKDVALYQQPLDAPGVPIDWDESLCGPPPFHANVNHYTTGQGSLPSLACELCNLVPDGYVLQLPYPNVTYQEAFLKTCVEGSISSWFEDHVSNGTSVVISDAITISSDNRTVERHQVAYERLEPLNLWWWNNLSVTHRKRLWLVHLAACLSFIVFLQQALATLMDVLGGGQYQTFFSRILKTILKLLLIFHSFGLFYSLSLYGSRWRKLMKALATGSPSAELPDNKKHARVRDMYQELSTLGKKNSDVLWVVLVLLIFQLLDLFTCTRGYLHGLCQAAWRLLVSLAVALCWACLLVLLAYVFHHEDSGVFRDLRTSFRTLFVTRDLDVRYEEEASVTLMVLLHVTTFLLVPFFLGLLLANLKLAREMKRGRKRRWWVGSPR